MVARGKLTPIEVQAALEAQRSACYGKIGEWIEKLGFASESEVTKALALQWGCPVATSFDPSAHYLPGDIPLAILEAYQMLPLNYVAGSNTLYLAFGERVDHAALYAIEKILECHTLPCVAGREAVARQLEAMRQLARPGDVEFGPMTDLGEMARIASSYTSRLSPGQVRMSRVGRFIWLRLYRDFKPSANKASEDSSEATKVRSQPEVFNRRSTQTATNLVFRLPQETAKIVPITRSIRDLFPAN